jgi:hypothetical protein
MAASSKSTHRALASLHVKPSKTPALITYAQGIVKGMTGNPAFPTPNPPLAEVSTAIGDLQTAETAALARTKGAVAVRNEKRTALMVLLQLLKAYVQVTADANVENGPSIIESAGMAVRKVPVRAPRVFEARAGNVSGTVRLIAASAAHRASYDWEYSTDGGKTWIGVPATLRGHGAVPVPRPHQGG